MQVVDIRTKQSQIMVDAIEKAYKGDECQDDEGIAEINIWLSKGRIITEQQYIYLCKFIDGWGIDVKTLPR